MKYFKIALLLLANTAVFSWIVFLYQAKYSHIPLREIVTRNKKLKSVSWKKDGCNYVFNQDYIPEVSAFGKADWDAAHFTFDKTGSLNRTDFPIHINLRSLNGTSQTRQLTLWYNPKTGLMRNGYSQEAAIVSPRFEEELARVLKRMPKEKSPYQSHIVGGEKEDPTQ